MHSLPGTIYLSCDYAEEESLTLFVKLKDIDEHSFVGAIIYHSITSTSSSRNTRRFFHDSQESLVQWFQSEGHERIIDNAFCFPVPYSNVLPVENELDKEAFLSLYVPNLGHLEKHIPYDRRKVMTKFLRERQEFLRHMLFGPYQKPKPRLFL